MFKNISLKRIISRKFCVKIFKIIPDRTMREPILVRLLSVLGMIYLSLFHHENSRLVFDTLVL